MFAGTATIFGEPSNLVEGLSSAWGLHNTDCKFTTLNVPGQISIPHMEIEEAIMIGLLAVGMSLLAVLTIMIFW